MSLKAKSSQNRAHNGATMYLIFDRRAQVEKVLRARNDVLNANSSKTLNFKWNSSLDVFLLESVREAPKNNMVLFIGERCKIIGKVSIIIWIVKQDSSKQNIKC